MAILSPLLILVLCVVAGLGTVMILPGRKETAWVKIGGAAALAAGLILTAVLVRLGAHGGREGLGAYFWIFSGIAVASALRVVTHPRPVYSAMYFVLTVLASAGLFVLLWAQFVAVALVVIYAGAILVTYVFVIMLAQQAQSPGEPAATLTECDQVSREPVLACALGFLLMGVLLFVIFDRAQDVTAGRPSPLPSPGVPGEGERGAAAGYDGTTQALGRYLFQSQLVNLELAGVILTVAMVGAIAIARRRIIGGRPAEPSDVEVVTTPGTPVDDNPHSIPVYGTKNPRQKEYPQT